MPRRLCRCHRGLRPRPRGDQGRGAEGPSFADARGPGGRRAGDRSTARRCTDDAKELDSTRSAPASGHGGERSVRLVGLANHPLGAANRADRFE